ncbi:lysophospholipid acyltransferase family protein [Streptomyces sp. NPDC046203]|uniref:lysophospholipid acyltransferase family protein n=1 Tax=Streptomyces sp. NPDC046203 TaxID=3154602 RepID=UPI00340CABB8
MTTTRRTPSAPPAPHTPPAPRARPVRLPAPPAAGPSPWLPTSPCTPGRCAAHPGLPADLSADPSAAPSTDPSTHPSAGPSPGRAAASGPTAAFRLAAGLGTALLGVLLAPFAAPLPPAGRRLLVRVWCRGVLGAFGVRVRVTGRPVPRSGPLLVVANHVSWLDVPLVAAVLPGRMLAKREVRDWPVFGPLAALGGTLFVDRERIRALPGTVDALGRILVGGGRAVAFPEGTTWCGRAHGEFRPAVFQAARDTGTDVLPIRLVYTPVGTAAYVGADTLGASLWRVVRARRLVAEIRIREPIPASRCPDRRTLARAARTAVTDEPTEPAERHKLCRPHEPHEPHEPYGRVEPAGRPDPRTPGEPAGPFARLAPSAQSTIAKDSANRPASSVHQCANESPDEASSARTPS